MAPSYRFTLFGVPALRNGDGREIPLRTRKQYALFAVLVVEGQDRPVQRDRLTELIWPDVSGERGRHSLSQAITELRGQLDVGLFSRGGETVRLVRRIRTELDEIADGGIPDRLQTPLAGADNWVGAAFAHWADAARQHCIRQACDGLREAIRRLRKQGKLNRTHDVADALYALDPLSDVAVHALAERLLVRGDVVGAIRLLREHTARVQEEVGCNPQPDVTRLLRRLEAGDPSVETVPAQFAVEAKQLRPPVFVGREDELSMLEAEWEAARSERLRSCVIRGPSGIGKTTLMRRFAESVAARAHPIFIVDCQEMGSRIPFSVAADLIARFSKDPNLSGTDPEWLAEAARLHARLRTTYPGIPDPPATPAEILKHRLGEALTRMLEALTDPGAVLLGLDDVHYLDPASRDLLFLMLRSARELPVLIIGTEIAPPGASKEASHSANTRSMWQTQVDLVGLRDREADELALRLVTPGETMEPRVLERLKILAEGNPQFVELLISDLKEHRANAVAVPSDNGSKVRGPWNPPSSLRAAFEKRTRDLTGNAKSILEILAVAGRPMVVPLLERLCGLDHASMAHEIVHLSDNGFLRLEQGALGIKSELHRAVAYYSMSPSLRAFWHGELADGISAGPESSEVDRSIETGRHLLRAGRGEEGSGILQTAAVRAIGRGAHEEAELALLSALPQVPDSDRHSVVLILAAAQVATAKYEPALRTLGQLGVDDFARPFERARFVLLSTRIKHGLRLSAPREIAAGAALAVRLAAEAKDDEILLSALQLGAEAAVEEWDEEAIKSSQEAAKSFLANTQEPLLRAQARLTVGFTALLGGDAQEAVTSFAESADTFARHGLSGRALRAVNARGLASNWGGDFRGAEQSFLHALGISSPDASQIRTTVWGNLGGLYHDFGWPEAADLSLLEAERCARLSGSPRSQIDWISDRLTLCYEERQHEHASELVRLLTTGVESLSHPRDRADVRLIEAEFFLATGNNERAWPIIEQTLVTVGPRAYMLGDAVRHERLHRHFTFICEGYAAYLDLCRRREGACKRMKLSDRVELTLFDVWVRQQMGELPEVHTIENLLRSTGLIGPYRKLSALSLAPNCGRDLALQPTTEVPDADSLRRMLKAAPAQDS